MMLPRLPRLLLVLASLCLLAACTHSRVVRRDYDDSPPASSPSRAARMPVESRAAPSPIPRDAVHVVRAGETLYGISFRYGLRYQDVAAWNGISVPYTIEIGQRLRLRSPGNLVAPPPSTPAAPVVAAVPPPRPRAPGSTPAPRPPASASTGTQAVASATVPVASANPSPPPTRPYIPPPVPGPSIFGAPKWRWPTQGQIIGHYVAGDQTQQGINIAGNAGQPVLASADGIVVYSGAGLVGYGELIIIKHSDEWLSAYAHNRKRLVAEGARVKAGDTIAEMGHTGAIRDMLHFEIRRNGKPVDPLGLLPRP
jgi:lipoprotein NlpD